MNINNLSITKNAQVFELKKEPTKISIEKYFKTIKKEGNFIIKEVRFDETTSENINVKYSFVLFKTHEEPSFLISTNLIDIKYGYCLLIEIKNSLVVYKKNAESPEKSLSHYIKEYDYSQICHFKGDEDPDYEKISMNNMSLSNAIIRSRSYEALQLNGIISNITTGRSIPRNFRMKVKNEIYTLTPNTSRITLRDKKCNIKEIINWSGSLINDIQKNTKSSFISNFATPIKLEEIIKLNIKVSSILINISNLEADSYNEHPEEEIYFNRRKLSKEKKEVLFKKLKECMEIENNQWIKNKQNKKRITLRINLKSISLQSKILNKIKIRNVKSNNEIPLTNYINKNRLLSCVFTNPNYSYWYIIRGN
ncbi:hypothetical protein N1711_13445 [Proteus vulgaris]|uniref:hypothetical protein n=1 Tax=Proteus vulgaris TaxID=585 RepID=UPI0021A4C968|nr:hypothetical protein [Proteus vulgaris]UWT99485.1 hypothetical protein N1711_13445 [Proteus vulgaris]